MLVRDMVADDVYRGFRETLACLAPVDLTPIEVIRTYFHPGRHTIHTLVAIDEPSTKVVGTLSLWVEKKYIHQGGLVGHVEDFAVHDDYRNQGIGKLLIEAAIERCRQAGAYKLILDCKPDLVGYYEQYGFYQKEVQMRLDLCGNATGTDSAETTPLLTSESSNAS
jgi:glucosamine-phosphate N-acetyltransferase